MGLLLPWPQQTHDHDPRIPARAADGWAGEGGASPAGDRGGAAERVGQTRQPLVKTSGPKDLTCGIAASPRWERPKMSSMVRSVE